MTSKKPSAWWYVAAAAIAVIGGGGSVFYGCSQAAKGIRSMDRYVVPGEHDLQLPAGRTTFFYERDSEVDGVRYVTSDTAVLGLSCTLTGADGTRVELGKPSMDQSYSLAGYSGRSAMAADVEQAGSYRLACAHDSPPGPTLVLAVGDGFSVKSILIAIIGGAAALFLAVPILVITLVRRRSRVPPAYR